MSIYELKDVFKVKVLNAWLILKTVLLLFGYKGLVHKVKCFSAHKVNDKVLLPMICQSLCAVLNIGWEKQWILFLTT